jgi:hypothetical protein
MPWFRGGCGWFNQATTLKYATCLNIRFMLWTLAPADQHYMLPANIHQRSIDGNMCHFGWRWKYKKQYARRKFSCKNFILFYLFQIPVSWPRMFYSSQRNLLGELFPVSNDSFTGYLQNPCSNFTWWSSLRELRPGCLVAALRSAASTLPLSRKDFTGWIGMI